MKRKNMRSSSTGMILGICFAGLLILAACSGSAAPEPTQASEFQEVQAEGAPPTQALTETNQPTDGPTEEIQPIPTFDQAANDTAPEEAYPTPGDQASGYPAPGEGYPPPENETAGYPSPVEDNPPPVKMALEATDPSTVSLASGELQLIEFFAFW
jgi:hypothetical protein